MNKSNIVQLDAFHRGFERLDQFNFHHVLAESKGLILVLFKKNSCSSCSYWRQLLLNYQSAHRQTRLCEVDLEQDQALANEFDIFHLPVIQIYKDGDYYGEVQCEARINTLKSCLDEALAHPPQDMP